MKSLYTTDEKFTFVSKLGNPLPKETITYTGTLNLPKINNSKLPFTKKENPFNPSYLVPNVPPNYLDTLGLGKQTACMIEVQRKLEREINELIERSMGIQFKTTKLSFTEKCYAQYAFDQWCKTMFPEKYKEDVFTIDSLATALKTLNWYRKDGKPFIDPKVV